MISSVLKQYGINICREIRKGGEATIYYGFLKKEKITIKHTKSISSASNEFKYCNQFNSISRPINQIICDCEDIFLIMPYLSGPDLFDYADENSNSKNYIDKMKNPLNKLIKITNYLQKHSLNHLDIKPENLFVIKPMNGN